VKKFIGVDLHKQLIVVCAVNQARQVMLRPADRFVLDDLWLTLDHYHQRLCGLEQALKEFARSASAPKAQARRLLKTIPGVGPTTIEIFLAELADVRRFGSQKKVTAYAGLAPGQRESGGRCKALGITHTGSGLLRWVLNQASWQLVRRDARWQRIFEALAKRRGKTERDQGGSVKAITAVSRRLLCLMTSMVLNEQPYRRAA